MTNRQIVAPSNQIDFRNIILLLSIVDILLWIIFLICLTLRIGYAFDNVHQILYVFIAATGLYVFNAIFLYLDIWNKNESTTYIISAILFNPIIGIKYYFDTRKKANKIEKFDTISRKLKYIPSREGEKLRKFVVIYDKFILLILITSLLLIGFGNDTIQIISLLIIIINFTILLILTNECVNKHHIVPIWSITYRLKPGIHKSLDGSDFFRMRPDIITNNDYKKDINMTYTDPEISDAMFRTIEAGEKTASNDKKLFVLFISLAFSFLIYFFLN
ncbi:MAG TPA: hypothetical protein VEC16_04200 [Alphaproteobacteria bacterium]|nr:hypothetical protein [Alphaproteobacteria bacterium]